MFRPTARLLKAASTATATATSATSNSLSSLRTRTTTNLTGLSIHPSPLPQLTTLYTSTLNLLSQMPPGAVYRQSVESITKDRLHAVESLGSGGTEEGIMAVEEEIGAGVIEEVILQAEGELKLAGKMLEWKAWEDLETAPPAGQWAPFKITPSTTAAEDLR